MKIGIITLHDTCNYGSMLQTYGLYKYLKNKGLNVEIIDYQCKTIHEKEYPPKFVIRQPIKSIYRVIRYGGMKTRKIKEFHRFLNTNMKVSKKRYTLLDIASSNNEYDIFISGSDIIWNLENTGNDTTYYLDFVQPNKIMFSYASSMGLENNQLREYDECLAKKYLSRFKYITVREPDGINQLDKILNININVVADPTLLLENKIWKEFVNKMESTDKYILVYFLDKNHLTIKFAHYLASKKNLKIKFINFGKKYPGVDNIRPYSIEEFLSYIYNAEFVVGASYHGVIFSIIFQKQFFYVNRGRKSRINQIMSVLKTTNRDIETNDWGKKINERIDYDKCNKLLDKYREYSRELLDNMVYKYEQ